MSITTKTFVLRLISMAILIAVAVSIFVLSAQPANKSKQTSDKVVQIAEKIPGINNMLPDKKYKKAEKIRDLAHMGLYLLLGISCAVFAFTFSLPRFTHPLLSTLACGLFSVGDEWHQKFVDGRSWEARDLGNDAIGYIVGIAAVAIVYYTIYYVINLRRNKL